MDNRILSTFCVPRHTASGGTAFARLIPPMTGLGGSGGLQTGKQSDGIIHVTRVCYTTGATAHLLGLMRPFNYTTFSADAAAAQAVVNITADPGLYATAANWKYGSIPNGTPRVANNAIAGSDYVVYQCADGTYVVDTVSSVSSLAITLTNNVPTGGVKAGGLFYFFGVIGDSDPNTAAVNPQSEIAASQTRDVSWADPAGLGVVSALHAGDPMIFYSPNGTNAGVLEYLCGYYARY